MGMLPGLARDTYTISRDTTVVPDAEGNTSSDGLTLVSGGQGAWGTASATDREVGAQRGQTIDAILAVDLAVDIRAGDMVSVRGHNWVVLDTQDVRIHQRALLLEVS